jgi:hypothetical protein
VAALAVLKEVGAIIGVLGLLIYGFVRVAHDTFYNSLGVMPEEVGLGQTIILQRAALYLAFLFIASVAYASLAALPGMLLRVLRHRRHRRRFTFPLGRIAFVLLLSFPIVFYIEFRQLFLDFLLSTLATKISAAAILILSAIAILSAVVLTRKTSSAAWIQDRSSRAIIPSQPLRGAPPVARTSEENDGWQQHPLALSLFTASLAVLAALLLFLASEAGGYAAQRVRVGEPVEPSRFEILAIRADPVCLRWTDNSRRALEDPGPYMYLGESRSQLIIYDYKGFRNDPIRLPNRSAIVTAADLGVVEFQDDTELTYMCINPRDGAVDVAVDSPITIALARDVTGASITLQQSGSPARVAGTLSRCRVLCSSVTFVPKTELTNSTEYFVTVSYKKLGMHQRGTLATWFFTTSPGHL